MEIFAPTPNELIRKYGAKKIQDDKYEISVLNLPWVYKKSIDIYISPDKTYIIEGVSVDGLSPPWEVYIALVDEVGEYGVGYIISRRKKFFKCVYKHYTKPIKLQTAQYLIIKPLELYLTDIDGVINCVDRSFNAKYIVALVNAPVELLNNVKVNFMPVVKEIFKYQ
ncbi:MAG: hypothetical protein QXD08_02625 [Pyrobaculum sp.]